MPGGLDRPHATGYTGVMKRLLLAAAPIAALLLPGSATACMMDPIPGAMMHSALPRPLPAGAIVAEVEADPDATDLMLVDGGIRVRVHRMIQGEAAPVLILRADSLSSCDDVFGNGRRGLIIAIPAGHQEGIPIAMPIFVVRSQGYRLPDGYRLPPPSERGPRIGD
jgi:hypothetical protein